MDDNGGIKSNFQFISYKIDRIEFKGNQNIKFLLKSGGDQRETFDMAINIRQPAYVKSKKYYIGGIDAKISQDINPEKKREGIIEELDDNTYFILKMGIAGVFSVEEGRFDQKLEENLVKLQIPSLLFPYLRVGITSVLSSAGLGVPIMPLINVHNIAKKMLGETPITILE